MTNGGIPKLETHDDVLPWAIHHRAVTDEKWHNQDGVNEHMQAWMQSQERRIQRNENRGAFITGVAVVVGGIIAALVPLFIR